MRIDVGGDGLNALRKISIRGATLRWVNNGTAKHARLGPRTSGEDDAIHVPRRLHPGHETLITGRGFMQPGGEVQVSVMPADRRRENGAFNARPKPAHTGASA